jgi:tRNA dimethylallyltransferase
MNTNKRKIIAIVGPTASGKTGIGVRLAKEFNGEIISADSRQVYRGLDLGTGKDGAPAHSAEISNDEFLISKQIPKQESFQLPNGEQGDWTLDNWKLIRNSLLEIRNLQNARRFVDGIPQWLIDIKEPGEKFTLFDWLPLARLAIEDIFSRGKTPIIVGGTGLYIQALIEGFALEQISNSQFSILQSSTNYQFKI